MPSLRETNTPKQVVSHLDHLEDLVVTRQYAGAKDAEAFITGLVSYFSGDTDTIVDLTVKIDGAPSIVVGKDPDDGKFFVGTKSAFSKTPKVAKSHKDIDTHYGERPGLADTMRLAFDLMKDMPWPRILQGDVLFTPDLKRKKTLNGIPHITFQPNTILYAVPLNSDLGKKFDAAKFGVTFHTTYTGSSLETLTASPGADIRKLPDSSSVAFLSNEYQDLSGVVTFTKPELRRLEHHIRTLKTKTPRLKTNAFVRMLGELPLLQREFMVFQNSLVRKNQPITLTPETFGKQFVGFLVARHRQMASKRLQKAQDNFAERYQDQQEIAALKQRQEAGEDDSGGGSGSIMAQRYKDSVAALQLHQKKVQAAKRARTSLNTLSQQYYQVATLVARVYTDVVEMLKWQHAVTTIKLMLLKKLDVPTKLQTFYASDKGLVAGPHEGFVAVDSSGNFVKLIDRAYFSRINFTHSRFRT